MRASRGEIKIEEILK